MAPDPHMSGTIPGNGTRNQWHLLFLIGPHAMEHRDDPPLKRRDFLLSLAALGLASAPDLPLAAAAPALVRAIPDTGERLPVIGMGSWITFDVGRDAHRRDQRLEVLRTFFEMGGTLVDSSPMYNSSEEVIGYCLSRMPAKPRLFSATKVWTWGQSRGVEQMEESRQLWGVERFDLMQIHNLLGWEGHLETLRARKAAGRLRYIGITTSHGRRHDDMQALMEIEPIDFVQLTYNILDRRAERRLLPLAGERGLAVIVNRPFRGGDLFDYFSARPLPEWAGEIDCTNWAQFFLKFVVSHPNVTCAIPATSRVDHMRENMGALYGRLPDESMRRQMIRYVEKL
jgi:diketogulonate reductase-like aldo/keto reductase